VEKNMREIEKSRRNTRIMLDLRMMLISAEKWPIAIGGLPLMTLVIGMTVDLVLPQ
jgi:hypothetical protein